MPMEFSHRGRKLNPDDITFIRELIARNPGWSRRRLSTQLCAAWDWVQPNGQPRDMVCRGLLLGLHRAGLIELPAKRFSPPNPLASRVRPPPLQVPAWDRLECPLAELGPVEVRQVRRTPQEKLFGGLMQAHHYLGYTQPVGEHLKYLYQAGPTPIACMAWSSSPRHLGARDRFIGWTAGQRRANLHLLAYNTRFLILPWVRVPHLASYLLARTARRISADWQSLYHHPIHLLETFIDPERFRATCYRAANWIRVGKTTGRGKDDQTNRANRSLKELWLYPLLGEFRGKLCHG
jgi:Druantia protein DruA